MAAVRESLLRFSHRSVKSLHSRACVATSINDLQILLILLIVLQSTTFIIRLLINSLHRQKRVPIFPQHPQFFYFPTVYSSDPETVTRLRGNYLPTDRSLDKFPD